MSSFLKAVQNESTKTFTENGDNTFSTTLNSNLDLFFMGSALRCQNEQRIASIFDNAMAENSDVAMANLFYLRDIRGGQGERNTFRIMLKEVARLYPEKITNELLDSIAKYGRYDDILTLLNTNKDLVISYIKAKLAEGDSLLAKWLPSENTSSAKTKFIAKIIRLALDMSSKDYRKTLSELRAKQKLIETSLTTKDYKSIKYSSVPSKAMMKYRKAFLSKDTETFKSYLDSVTKGEVKINTATLNPCEIVSKFKPSASWRNYFFGATIPTDEMKALDVMWNNLPNYFGDEFENSLVIADTSGSMTTPASIKSTMTCMDVSLSLAMYIAEKNKGLFKDNYITFSETPQLVQLKGQTLAQKLSCFKSIVANTNLDAVFDLILKSCIDNQVPVEDCPKRLYIISDMEFDSATGRAYNQTATQRIKQKYESAGYPVPQIVFWNVASRQNNCPVRYNESNVALVSGYSPVVLKYILNKDIPTPVDIMMEVLKRYM